MARMVLKEIRFRDITHNENYLVLIPYGEKAEGGYFIHACAVIKNGNCYWVLDNGPDEFFNEGTQRVFEAPSIDKIFKRPINV